MSQENLDERVRPYFEAVGRRDVAAIVQWVFDVFERRDLAAAMAVTLPSTRCTGVRSYPIWGAPCSGVQRASGSSGGRLDENWNDFRARADRDDQGGRVRGGSIPQSARVPESDTRVEGHNFAVVKFRDDGQIVEVHVYADRREALEAAGLRE